MKKFQTLFSSKPERFYKSFEEGNEQLILNMIQNESSENLFDPHLLIKNKEYLFTHLAALCGLDSIFRICCYRSSDFILRSLNSEGQTILHCICQKCNHKNHCSPDNKLKCLLFLINNHEDIFRELMNKQDDYGCTALHYIVKSNQPYLCEKLLQNVGINTRIVDKCGKTALDWCTLNCNKELYNAIKFSYPFSPIILTLDDESIEDKIIDVTNSINIPPNFAKELLKNYLNVEWILYQYYHHNLKIPNSIECEICCNKKDPYGFYWLKCNHCYCKNCWKNYVITKLKESENEIKCMKNNCYMIFTSNDINNLGEEIIKLYKNNIEKEILKQDRNLFPCPFPNCKDVINKLSITDSFNNYCIECKNHHKFCGLCYEKPHIPCSCDERREFLDLISQMSDKIDDDEDEDIRKAIDYINKTTKLCPNCHSRIEKNKGCNHMTCINCKHQFCWLCLGDWSIHGIETGGYYACNRVQEKERVNRMIRNERLKNTFKKFYQQYSLIDKQIKLVNYNLQSKVRDLIVEELELVKNSYIYMYYNNIPMARSIIQTLIEELNSEINKVLADYHSKNNNYEYHKEVYKNILDEYMENKPIIKYYVETDNNLNYDENLEVDDDDDDEFEAMWQYTNRLNEVQSIQPIRLIANPNNPLPMAQPLTPLLQPIQNTLEVEPVELTQPMIPLQLAPRRLPSIYQPTRFVQLSSYH